MQEAKSLFYSHFSQQKNCLPEIAKFPTPVSELANNTKQTEVSTDERKEEQLDVKSVTPPVIENDTMSIIVPKIPQQNGLLIGIQANMPHQVVTTLQTHVSNVEKPSNEQEGTFELKQSLNDFNENNPFEFMGDVFNTGFTEDILSQVITTVPVILQPYALPSTLSTPTLNTEQVTPVEIN